MGIRITRHELRALKTGDHRPPPQQLFGYAALFVRAPDLDLEGSDANVPNGEGKALSRAGGRLEVKVFELDVAGVGQVIRETVTVARGVDLRGVGANGLAGLAVRAGFACRAGTCTRAATASGHSPASGVARRCARSGTRAAACALPSSTIVGASAAASRVPAPLPLIDVSGIPAAFETPHGSGAAQPRPEIPTELHRPLIATIVGGFSAGRKPAVRVRPRPPLASRTLELR